MDVRYDPILWLVAFLVMVLFNGGTNGDTTQQEEDCGPGWRNLHRACYRFSQEPMTWDKGLASCQQEGGTLMSVSSRIEMDLLKAHLRSSSSWWIGLRLSPTKANTFEWLDGGPFSARVTRWKTGEPNNQDGAEECVEMQSDGYINDKNCQTERSFICERHEITVRPFEYTTMPIITSSTTTIPTTTANATMTTSTATEIATTTTTSTPLTTTTTSTPLTTTTTSTPLTTTTTPPLTTTTTPPLTTSSPVKASSSTTTSQVPEVDLYELYAECFLPDSRENRLGPFLYTLESFTCPSVLASRIHWPETSPGVAYVQCQNGEGLAHFECGGSPICWRGVPNIDQCASPKFKKLLEQFAVVKEVNATQAEHTVAVTSQLASVTETTDITADDVIVASKMLQSLSAHVPNTQNITQVSSIVMNVVKAGSNLVSVNKTQVWANMTSQDKIRSATSLLVAMETTTMAMTADLKQPTTITSKDQNIELELRVINITSLATESEEELVYDSDDSENSFAIPIESLKELSRDGLAKVVFMTHYTMGNILDSGPVQEEDESDVNLDHEEKPARSQLASYILSASVGTSTDKLTKLTKPVTFTMKHIKLVPEGYYSLCSFWSISHSEMGSWSQDGCHVVITNASQTTCECDHLTNFAVLMAVTHVEMCEKDQSLLRLATIVGCVISCFCLLASWVTFTCFTTLQGERNSIHKNLVVCLFIGEMLFLTGIDQTQHKLACSFIAGFLHYFFLAAFIWMLLEGVHIVLMLVQVFDASRSRLPYYYAAAYAPPVLVVAISAGFYHQGYGTDKYCWLTTDRYFIWSFAGPVAVILCVNAVVLVYAMTMVCRHSEYVFSSKDKITAGGIRSWIQGAMALEVLLGLTWVLGYFYINENTLPVAYVFTILNSLQGLFIFCFHCLLNKKARKEYRRVIGVKRRPSTSTSATGSGTHTASLVNRYKLDLSSGHTGSAFSSHA